MAGDYVVKIEPKENGPLFCETHFYSNCAKKDDRKLFVFFKEWVKKIKGEELWRGVLFKRYYFCILYVCLF